jgi:molybdate transport system permease protein
LGLSIRVALVATALVALVGLPLAYLLAMREFRGKSLLDVVLTLPLVLPPVVTGYYLLLVIGRNGALGGLAGVLGMQAPQLTFTWQASALASFVVALPFTVKTGRAAFEGVDRDLVATSLTLGRSELSTALRVTFPLAARGLVAGLVLSFARALGEFGATIMVAGNVPGRTNTMPLEIYNAVVYGDWRSATMLVAVFTLVSAGFLLAAGRLTKKVTW